MAVATIQFTQDSVAAGAGESVIGYTSGDDVTLTDAGGAGASSYLWEIVSWPAPDASAPAITNDTSQIATVSAPFTDGVYLVRLTRTDGVSGTTSDVKFFAVADKDGLSLPSPGQNRNNSNVGGSADAQEAGWFGSTAGGTNVFLDAYLRLRKLREGRYVGPVAPEVYGSGSPTTSDLTWGLSAVSQWVSLIAGSGNYTVDLQSTGASLGGIFHFRVTLEATAGDFLLVDDGGSTILTLTPPPAGSMTYEVSAVWDGSNWAVVSVGVTDASALLAAHQTELVSVSGVQSTSEGSYQRAGTLRLAGSNYPASSQFTFEASFDTTNASNAASVQLYNLTDAGVVSGSTFTTTSTVSDTQSATVTIPSATKDYEVQVKLNSADPAERATVTRASLKVRWI